MHRVVRSLPVVFLVALMAAVLTACGGASGGATSAPSGGAASVAASSGPDDSATFGGTKFATDQVAQKVNITTDASGQFKWDKTTFTATAGDVTFVVKNPSAMEHEFSVDGNGINYTSPTLKAGATGTYTIKGLKAGEYRLVCKVAGHEQLGMVAKLVVK